MKIIRFKKQMLPYNTGDLAGFTDKIADSYVERGLAELHNGGKPVVKEAAPEEKQRAYQNK